MRRAAGGLGAAGVHGHTALAATLLLAAACGAGRGDERLDGPVTKRALLVGINEYRADDGSPRAPFRNLQGARNDVELVRGVLTGRMGFAPDHVTVLLDRAATREAILAALRRLVADSGPDDEVYVHYSGHGSQVRDLNGDEADGFDETILPHDARTEGVPDITDDELGEILAALRTPHVLVVLDSCHSGTATRGAGAGAVRVRAVPPDARTALYARGANLARRSSGAAAGTGSYALMTGAAEDQSALDGPVGDAFYGFFSWSFAEALRDAPADATPAALFARVKTAYAATVARYPSIPAPAPQLEGPPAVLQRPLWRAADAAGPGDAGRTRALAALRALAPAGGDAPAARIVGGAPGTAPPRFVPRGDAEPRSSRNSLQVELRATAETFVTLAEVDAAGRVTIVFPNEFSDTRAFLPDGRVPAGATVLLPDALTEPNASGFFVDAAPPLGPDTLVVLTAASRDDAQRLRAQLAGSAADAAGGPSATGPAAGTLRGVRVVAARDAPAAGRTVRVLEFAVGP